MHCKLSPGRCLKAAQRLEPLTCRCRRRHWGAEASPELCGPRQQKLLRHTTCASAPIRTVGRQRLPVMSPKRMLQMGDETASMIQ